VTMPAGVGGWPTQVQVAVWPKGSWTLPVLARRPGPASSATPGDLAKQFKRAQPTAVAEILETLATLGRARKQNGKFTR